MKTIRRDWLKKQILAGKLEAKCDYHLTDDYAADNANNGGKTGWMPARISQPTFATYTNEHGSTRERCNDHDFIEGQMNFRLSDFTTSAGRAYWESDTHIALIVHGNAAYALRMRQAEPAAAQKPRIRLYPTVTVL